MRISARGSAAWLVVLAVAPLLAASPTHANNSYRQRHLVSDGFIVTPNTDPNLVNPWGIAFNPVGFVWIADNGTDVSTLYDGHGTPSPQPDPLVVHIPRGAPTGIVFNGSPTDFALRRGGSPAATPFIFVTEKGTVAAWAPGIDFFNAIQVFRSDEEAIYKGVAIARSGGNPYLYATDFHNRRIDAFDTNFQPATLAGTFSDPNLPPRYAPLTSPTSTARST